MADLQSAAAAFLCSMVVQMTRKGLGRWAQIARELKRRFLRRALFRCGGSVKGVAAYIGMDVDHTRDLLNNHGLRIPEQRIGRPRKVVNAEPKVAKPEPVRFQKREWFGVEVSP